MPTKKKPTKKPVKKTVKKAVKKAAKKPVKKAKRKVNPALMKPIQPDAVLAAVIGSKPERPRKLPKSRELYAKRYLRRAPSLALLNFGGGESWATRPPWTRQQWPA